MKYLGIDYGTKKIGIALSDERGVLAFPYEIVPNNREFLAYISSLVEREQVGAIVVGESVQLDGTDNVLMNDIRELMALLEGQFAIPLYLEKEWLSSFSARSDFFGKDNIANPKWSEKENEKRRSPIDDNAAAIILQRFLDKQAYKK
ncbi:MAG: Holliday junction resolvase RuvX [Candidatus Pacebacteria bacterium]|nr:Holliday junction resolvase RuvX [Candidatus Paceibacterota bacterium]